ncbi:MULTISPECIES: hypothetical protein [Streptomycetaceae]|uniref:hypothetical protein n=1 Tax=Streptomycetaceae TaxID=2062 RepID=UPI00036F11E7|nr:MULTISPECIES: hypothetical protein [Streptomycetaceae]
MTGPEHFREAERLADMAHHYTYGDGADSVTGAALAAEAQVHATLALAVAASVAAIPRGKVLADQCRTAEPAHGRQCLKADGHSDGHDFGFGYGGDAA